MPGEILQAGRFAGELWHDFIVQPGMFLYMMTVDLP